MQRPLPSRLLVRIALWLRRRLLTLANALAPPRLPLFECATGIARTQMLAAAARLRIADLLAAGPLGAPELAERTGCDAGALRRTLRALVSVGVFRLERDGRFANNRLSAGLRSEPPGSFRDFADYFGSASNVAAWAGFEGTLESGKNAFERVHGMSVWQWFDSHDHERAMFAGAMRAMTRVDAPGLAQAYPFGEVNRVCDVAGGSGELLAEVLCRHRRLRGVLLDSPGVLAAAGAVLAARGVAQRVELAAGDFFESVPAGCDAYILKNVLHDWDDERALAILRTCRRAMQPGSRLIVVELVVELNDARGIGPMSDVQMMLVCGGRERGRAEFARLFHASGFELRRVLPTTTLMSIVEGVAV